jgi:predicted MFS family arabinose efflux permease
VAALVALRFLLGLAEGIHFPMASAIVSRWFPLGERSRANGTYILGVQFAVILGSPLLVPLIDRFGWRAMFLVLGGVCLLISLPVVVGVLRDDGPYLPETTAGRREPLLRSFRIPDYWLVLIAGILSNIIIYGLLTWLPTYLAKARNVPFAELAAGASAPFWLATFAIPFWGVVGDRTNKRALFAAIGCGVCGTGIYFAAKADTLILTVVLISIATFFQNAYQTAEFAFVQRIISADRVGAGTGLYNGVAIIVGGAGGTALIGKVVELTGSYDAGLMVVVIAAWINLAVLGFLYYRIRY